MALRVPQQNNANLLYQSIQSAARTEHDHFLLDLIFMQDAFSDGNRALSTDEAKMSERSARACVRKMLGFFSYYDDSCLERAVYNRFRFKEPLHRTYASRDRQNFLANIEAVSDPLLVAWMWNELKDHPLLQLLLFYHPNAKPFLSYFGGTGSWNIEAAKKYIAPAIEGFKNSDDANKKIWEMELIDTSTIDGFTTMINDGADVVKNAASRLEAYREYALSKENPSHLKSGNSFALLDAIKLIGENQDRKMIGWLKDITQTHSDPEVVRWAFHALATFPDSDAVDFLVERGIDGGFNERLVVFGHFTTMNNLSGFKERAINTLHRDKDEWRRFFAGDLYIKSMTVSQQEESTPSKMAMYVAESQMTRDQYRHQRWFPSLSPVTFTTMFFRFPIQLKWVTEELKKLAAGTKDDLTVVTIGTSYGPEAYSLLFFLDSDFRRDPESWGGVHPAERVKIYATDVDESALMYAKRGRFVWHPSPAYSEVPQIELWEERYGIDPHEYFDTEDGVYLVKDKWRENIVFEELDVLNLDGFIKRHGRPDGVLYNMVDGHLPKEEDQIKAATGLAAFPRAFLAATPRLSKTPEILREEMMHVRTVGATSLYYPFFK